MNEFNYLDSKNNCKIEECSSEVNSCYASNILDNDKNVISFFIIVYLAYGRG